MSVVLIGYRGSGKTTVGRLLARCLGVTFVDTDETIVRDAGCSIAEIFATEGEAGFRRREREAIISATSDPKRVVAVGGGAVESAENRELLGSCGTVVWLEAPADVLWQRMQSDPRTAETRPDLAGGGLAEIEEVLARRDPLYRATADMIVNVANALPDRIAEEIQQKLAEA